MKLITRLVLLMELLSLSSVALSNQTNIMVVTPSERDADTVEESLQSKEGVDVLTENALENSICSSELVIATSNQTYLKVLELCPNSDLNLVGLNLSRTDALSPSPKNVIFSSADIAVNISLAHRYFNNIGIVYSEDSEEAVINQVSKAMKKGIFSIKVRNPSEAVKAVGLLSSKTQAIVIGGNPEIFEGRKLKTMGEISINTRVPIIGGHSKELLREGVLAGMYFDQVTVEDVIKSWRDGKQLPIIKEQFYENKILANYLGLPFDKEQK